MKFHEFQCELWLPLAPAELFVFFADAANLDTITPPWLNFHIVTPRPIETREGALIDYKLRVRGVPLRWRTLISEWQPETRFVDVQERGPYALWEHTHVFTPLPGGTLVGDRVRYALPLGPLGSLAHALGVRAALAAIFDFRFQRIRELLPGPA